MSNIRFYPYKQLECPFPQNLDDYGQSKKLIEFVNGNIRYVEGLGCCSFNGCYWQSDPYCVEKAAMALTDFQLENLKRIDAAALEAAKKIYGKEITRKDFFMFVKKNRSASGIANIVKVFKAQIGITPSEEMDIDPYLLSTPGGVYDLHKGMNGFRAAKSSDMCTLCTAVAPCDTGMDIWLDALNTATGGNQQLIDFIQLVAGLGLIGEVRIQQATIVWGKSGSAKSTIWNPMTQVLGSYAINLHADVLLSDKVSDSTAMSERASLRKKRWALCSEVDEGTLNESALKKLVSTDPIKGRFLYQTAIQFEPSHSVYCYLNTLPALDSLSDAVRNRLMVIPFTAKIDSGKKIFNYGKFLYANAAPAILAWMIEGARKIIELDFKLNNHIPDVVSKFMNDYFIGQDWLTEFLDDVCTYGADQTVNSGQIYDVYIAYCRNKNKKPVSTAAFSDLMKSRFEYESKRITEDRHRVKKSVYKGLSLNMIDWQVRRYLGER